MAYTLREAALAIGKNKPTVLRAIQAGRISASRDATGNWLIEPAELQRVYPVSMGRNASSMRDMTRDVSEGEAVLKRELEVLREERERERHEAQATIADLRRRLDTATEQLGEALLQVKVLADQRAAPLARRWWRRWR